MQSAIRGRNRGVRSEPLAGARGAAPPGPAPTSGPPCSRGLLALAAFLVLVLTPAELHAADGARGRQLYVAQCGGCHGPEGAGDGPAATFIYPRPRDFLGQPFKLGGSQEEVTRTISRGIPGTSMPAFSSVIDEADTAEVAAYVRSLAGARALGLSVEPVTVPDPVGSIARGRDLYIEGCANCHGQTGRGDGPSAPYLSDDTGIPIRPPNYARAAFKGGSDPAALFKRISAGMPGTPMPAYADAYPERDRWDMVAFLQSLITNQSAPPVDRVVARRTDALPVAADDPAWSKARDVTLALNPLWQRPTWPPELTVRALHDGTTLAFQLQWPDATEDRVIGRVQDFSDAVALMLPERPGAVPFVGMGQGDDVARLVHWRAVADRGGPRYAYPLLIRDSSPLEHGPDVYPARIVGNPLSPRPPSEGPEPGLLELIAAGPGTVTALPREHVHVRGGGNWSDGSWTVDLRRPMSVASEDVPMPAGTVTNVAFAVWDGAAGDRNGQKSITQWLPMEIER